MTEFEDELFGIHGAWLAPVQEKEITRTCLRCDRSFTAYGKTNRVCQRCKKVCLVYADNEEYPVHTSGDSKRTPGCL